MTTAGIVYGQRHVVKARLATVDVTHSVYGRGTLLAADKPRSGYIDAWNSLDRRLTARFSSHRDCTYEPRH